MLCLWFIQCFLRLNLLCEGFKNWDGQFYTAWFAERLPHGKAKLPCWKQVMKTCTYHSGSPLSSNRTFPQTESGVFIFQYLPKGVGLAAKGKQEMAWKLIKLAENSFYASDQILQGPQLPPGYSNRKFGNRKRQYLFSYSADLQKISSYWMLNLHFLKSKRVGRENMGLLSMYWRCCKLRFHLYWRWFCGKRNSSSTWSCMFMENSVISRQKPGHLNLSPCYTLWQLVRLCGMVEG